MVIEIPGFGYVTPIGVGEKIGNKNPIWTTNTRYRLKSKNETMFWVLRLMRSYRLYFYVYDNADAYEQGNWYKGTPCVDNEKLQEFIEFIERN